MFYIRELSGALQAYQPGAIRERRAVRPVLEVSAIEASDNPEISGAVRTPDGAGARGLVFSAYARAENPDGRRRRVVYARDLMTAPVVTLSPDTPLGEVQGVFSRRRFRHLPVVTNDNRVEGIISDRDLLKLMAAPSAEGQRWELLRARELMAHPVLIASEDSEIREVARVLFEERVGCVPIVDRDHVLAGIVTRSDILRTLLVQAPLELWR